MSTSAFSGPYANRARSRDAASASTKRATPRSSQVPDTRSLFAKYATSEWLGHPGEPLRLRGCVECVTTPSPGTFTHIVRAEGTDCLVEWTTQRRYGLAPGDRLALAGRVKAHVTRETTRVTVLRDCFNPLRMA